METTVPASEDGAQQLSGNVVLVRYDPNLASQVTGEPAELAITFEEGAQDEPVMVVTFGPVETDFQAVYGMLVSQLRAHAEAPLTEAEL